MCKFIQVALVACIYYITDSLILFELNNNKLSHAKPTESCDIYNPKGRRPMNHKQELNV